MKNAMGFIHYCKYIACKKRWVNEKMACDCKVWVEVMKKRYSIPKTGIVWNLMMRFTLDVVYKTSCVLFASQVNNIILIVFKKIRSQIKKIKMLSL